MKRLVVLVAVAVSLIAAATSAIAWSGAGTARAADLHYFDPANIISDAVFYDSLSMDAPAIQDFLNGKGANCVAGEMPCLRNFYQDTAPQPGDAYCGTYVGAAQESAATIIAKVGQACRINPRVLLVLLQKEQGLVTGTRPTANQYNKATGFSCPDNAACNPAFAGFVSQIYFAARQFQRYRAGVVGSYRAGLTNTIGYYPEGIAYNNVNNTRCGTASVLIANQATAGLYDYTPYVPNQAALNAGYGTGDACSSYGNRNFWNYFTDWFGSTQSTGGGAIYTYYQQNGGSSGPLGAPLQGFLCGYRDGGCFQVFQYGSIYWSPATGAHDIMGDVGASWASRGWETGNLGYPVSDLVCGLVRGGCGQAFQGGSLYWSPGTGAHFVRGLIANEWGGLGSQNSWLGYPLTDEICGLRAGGCFNHFEGGSVYWSPGTGAHAVNTVIRNRWASLGWETGTLGYPVADPLCGLAAGGCRQDFQGGSMYWSAASGAAYTRGPIEAGWESTGTQDGPFGYPVGDVACGLRDGGCSQPFQRGWLFWSAASGTHGLVGDVGGTWMAEGGQNGPLGYPVGDLLCGLARGGCRQNFQGGNLYWSSTTGSHFVRGLIDAAWESLSSQDGALGYPVTDEICGLRNGGCFNHFEHGSIYWSPSTGAHSVSGSIRDAWAAQGWETGRWGYPTANPQTTGDVVTQRFQGGTATWDMTTGQVTFG